MRSRHPLSLALTLAALTATGSPTIAQVRPAWSSLTADRSAVAVGDSLTVVIVEASSAAATARSGTRRDTRLSGSIASGGQVAESGGLALESGYDGRGEVNRSGRLMGQIGVTVREVLPNGDLRVTGAQTLDIDGERTSIRLTARVRTADISGENIVLSSRLADAEILYDGEGSLSRSGSPALINRILSWFGLS